MQHITVKYINRSKIARLHKEIGEQVITIFVSPNCSGRLHAYPKVGFSGSFISIFAAPSLIEEDKRLLGSGSPTSISTKQYPFYNNSNSKCKLYRQNK